jgi:hypothetical protein
MSPRGELPLTESIACSLEKAALAERGRRWERLAQRALISADRTGETAARQRYRAEPGVREELEELVRLERECCPFLDMSVDEVESEVVLSVSGPPEAAEIIASFVPDASRA